MQDRKPIGPLERVVVVRHGQTEWSAAGRHTGRTDLPLTDQGRQHARQMQPALANRPWALVLCSPLRRAKETCELAGCGADAQIEPRLAEWDYGQYEGLTTDQIRALAPGWTVFTHGCPGGELARDVAARADAVIARALSAPGDVLLFSHGHMLRVLAARWTTLPPEAGARFMLDTAMAGVLGFERQARVLVKWNVPAEETRR